MDIYYRKQQWKLVLFLFAVVIGVSSLVYTNYLVRELSREEQKKVRLWAEATRQLADVSLTDRNFGFLLQVIQNNKTVPVILVDQHENILAIRNLDSLKAENPEYLKNRLEKMKAENEPIVIELGGEEKNYIYYSNSTLLKKLTLYPYIQLGVILLFIMVSYFAFSASRKAEQNQVWIGLTRETAHQLGTPTSSLLAWAEILREKMGENKVVAELQKDIDRLEKITERFSKIGSLPILERNNIIHILQNSIKYLKTRTPGKISYHLNFQDPEILVPVNATLFEWVVENLCRNAIDTMGGSGIIDIDVHDNTQVLYVDVRDSGKGIPKSRHKKIFKPGYTTKKRGWGLGLSLTKRIIEDYHDGKIFVYSSAPEEGTVIRIVMKK